MIHEIGLELVAKLKVQKCPVITVVDGPEVVKTTTFGKERIVLEHDEGGDSFGGARGATRNPNQRFTRTMGMKLTIYAQSVGAGAMPFEHRRRAEHILDLVLVAMDEIAKARANAWEPKGGKFVVPDDLAGSEVIGGAVYELSFSFDRGVSKRTWEGAKRPEITAGDLTFANSTTLGANEEETACGA